MTKGKSFQNLPQASLSHRPSRLCGDLTGLVQYVLRHVAGYHIWLGHRPADHAPVRVMTLVTMVQSIIPALAPLVGGLLVALLDWRAEFLFCAAYGRIDPM